MTGIFIIARLGSQRLPQKHLLQAAGKMFLEWEIERFFLAFEDQLFNGTTRIYIVTSSNPENRQFELLLNENNPYVSVFYGSDGNIPLRQIQCAERNSIDYIISVDGDDILCSTEAAKLVGNRLEQGFDLVKTYGLPLGMNIMGYRTEFLNSRMAEYRDKEKLETGWGKIFQERDFDKIRMGDFENDNRLRFTLDYEADRRFFETIIKHFQAGILTITDKDLIEFVINERVYNLNADLNEEYWQNFNALRNRE